MRYLTLHEVLEAHERILQQSGGELGVLNLGALESALAQPRMTFDACCAPRLAPGGRVVSAFRVRGIRSWRPFCGGLPGSMNSGKMPRRTHHADNWDSRARVLGANGTPLSVRIRLGRPNSLHTRVNTGLASATLVDDRAWQLSRKRR